MCVPSYNNKTNKQQDKRHKRKQTITHARAHIQTQLRIVYCDMRMAYQADIAV